MLKSFYKYLVDELITDYFLTHKPEKGSKYYILFENEVYRDGFYEALVTSSTASPITVSGIYENATPWMYETAYETFTFCPNPNGVDIIIGKQGAAVDDYLTTLRNAVGQEGKQYENYAVLNILSHDKLESLTTSCLDLHRPGCPLHQDIVLANMNKKLDQVTILDYERLCLREYAEKIKNEVAQNHADLFVFEEVLSILQNNPVTLNKRYSNLGYFTDRVCQDPTSSITEGEMIKRIKDNALHFENIKTIINSYTSNAEQELQKTYDVKLSAKIVRKDFDWTAIDYQDIFLSLGKKEEQANYKIIDIQLENGGNNVHITKQKKGSTKKLTIWGIVCDSSEASTTNLKIVFNKNIKDVCTVTEPRYKGGLISQYKIQGTILHLTLSDRMVKITVGKDNNMHTIWLTRVKTQPMTFDGIEPYFVLDSKGQVIIKAPEDVDSIKIGCGSNNVNYTGIINDLSWSDDYTLNVNLGDIDEAINIPILFGEKKLNIRITVDEKRIIPVKPTKLTSDIWELKISCNFPTGKFDKIRIGESEYTLDNKFRKYLEMEQLMVNSSYYSLKKCSNTFGYSEYEPQQLKLPELVREALDDIYSYYRRSGQVPTLSFIDDELQMLYKKYVEAVINIVNGIQINKAMSEEEFALTRLGVIEEEDQIMLSPFHPLLVAYMLEFKNKYKGDKLGDQKILKLITPFYLMPYISYNSQYMQPYCDETTQELKTWLFYELTRNEQQIRTYNITTLMVKSKMKEFIKYFRYLFQDKDSPIIISTIGIYDDTNVIKGLIEFVKDEYKANSDSKVRRIELHEYVHNLVSETFFEKINRLNSEELIVRELVNIDVTLESKDVTNLEIIRQIFTRVDFYKHDITECEDQINYCHIAFYQMETGLEFFTPPTDNLRTELSLNGLISIPSTSNQGGQTYTIGFGTKGAKEQLEKDGVIYPMARVMNCLYANEEHHGAGSFSPYKCVAKNYNFDDQVLLNSIYEQANWVTFLNPEVDINFFYKQNLYVVHYTDQYTINAKYDSITVTKQIDQYNNMLSGFYGKMLTNTTDKECFMRTMMNYFNSLNGDWLLSVINKTDVQIREKLSIVAACIMMRKFLTRNSGVTWIPISLEEILRVTGNIGLEQEYLFSKKSLGIKGSMSDDLLMVGLCPNEDGLKLYIYPIEVKASESNAFKNKASEQVIQTYNVFSNTLFGESNFTNDVYRTFFASQLLANTEKMWANKLIAEDEYQAVENCRYELLNLQYQIERYLPVVEMGKAATVSFVGSTALEVNTDIIEEIPICHIEVSLSRCMDCVCHINDDFIKELMEIPICLSDEVKKLLNSPMIMNSVPIQQINAIEILESENEISFQQFDGQTETNVEFESLIKHNNEVVRLEADSIDTNIDNALCDMQQSKRYGDVNSKYVESDDIILETQGIKIVVGSSKYNNQELIFEPNNTAKISHPNLGIIGTMGTGKTQFARSVIAQFSKETCHNVGGGPVGILVFDYKGDYKDKIFLETVNGECFRFNYPFNPLKLVVSDDVEGMNLPAITADRISDSFAKAYGLGAVQQSTINDVILDTYADFGITRDPKTWDMPVPTMNCVIDKFFDSHDANDRSYALFKKLSNYSIFTEDTMHCVSLFEWLKGVKVIDLTLYPDDTKKVIVSLILDLFYEEMKQLGESRKRDGYRELRAMIMVDEAHQFLKKDFNSFRSIISEGRMFGVGMILSTQSISDFNSKTIDYSQFILSWVIHHVNSISKNEIANIFGAGDTNSDKYVDFINKAKLFESVCKIGSRVEGIRNLPFYMLVEVDERFKKKEDFIAEKEPENQV